MKRLRDTAPKARRCLLRLFVTGNTPGSQRAIERVRGVCETHLAGEYDLEVIDIYQTPELAKQNQIIATPTLLRIRPPPLRRFIGDLSHFEGLLAGIRPVRGGS